MKASVQIVTTNIGLQSRPSITVKFDSGRYMFNVPEGIQRFSYSQAIRFSKLRGIFLSRINLDCMGGLPGLILTVSDTNAVSRLDIIAPTGITHYIAASHDFVMRKNIQIRLKEVQELEESKPVYKDETISVCAVKLLPETIPEDVYKKRLRAFKLDLPRKRKIVNQMFESKPLSDDEETDVVSPEESLKGTASSLCYILKGPTINGKFNAKKAMELNVQGKDRGRLAKGETVTLESGAIIYPHDVIGTETPGSIILLLDIPSKLYLESLNNNVTLQNVLLEHSNRPKIVIHQLGEGILDDARYQEWITKYCNGIQNVIISPGLHLNECSQEASKIYLDLLSHVDHIVFPALPKSEAAMCLPGI